MRITVTAFAAAREAIEAPCVQVELADGATVATALDAMTARYPKLAAMRDRLATAVDMAYVPTDHALSDGDELALIPPVSGG